MTMSPLIKLFQNLHLAGMLRSSGSKTKQLLLALSNKLYH